MKTLRISNIFQLCSHDGTTSTKGHQGQYPSHDQTMPTTQAPPKQGSNEFKKLRKHDAFNTFSYKMCENTTLFKGFARGPPVIKLKFHFVFFKRNLFCSISGFLR